ncbi:hypothetical protein J4Q44_G00173680 [Coregonus suidteri]|uniref:Glucosidase 2 subunit beta n=1 Tax=Coregonus suidteri TaxID=861788 RepID=A0AAN8QPC6_9TELE
MSCAHLLLLMSLALPMRTGAAVEIQRPRGVPLSKRQFYEENKPFTCLDGSRTIPFDRVNDDYCDCKDGSDEPGTAACPNGSFHCTNAGFRPAFIPSSRINDGICDCCDTTDEYNSGATCQNTCRELGRKERESLQIMAEITKEGFMLKQQLIHEAKRGQEDKQGKLTELQGSKKGLEEKVEALRTVKETAEDPEKEAKERHLKAWEEQKEVIRMEKDKARMAAAFLELDDDADGYVSVAELQSHLELDPDSDGSLTETETQGLLGGADKVDTSTFESVWSGIKDKYLSEGQSDPPAPVETPQEEETRDFVSDHDSDHYPEDYAGEEEDVEDDEEDDDHEEEEEEEKVPPTVPTPEKREDDEVSMPPYDAETQSLIDGQVLTELQGSKKGLEEKVEALRTVKETSEDPEKEAKERQPFHFLGRVMFFCGHELQSHLELDPDSDGSLTETETQGLLGGADKVDTSTFESVWSGIKDKYLSEGQSDPPAPVETPQEEETREFVSDHDSDHYPEDYAGEEEDVEDDEEDGDHEEEEEEEKVPPTVQTPEKREDDEVSMPPYDAETQSLIDAAQKARDDFDEAERALREVDDQMKNLEKEIGFDFGPSAEFAYLYSQCYELSTSEYIYRLCPFNRVSQKPKFGGSETNLGLWGQWVGPEDNLYSVMKYDHGLGCWQGPNRSTTVKLTCGKETVVTSTSEPSRCEYLMEFTTPAVCQEPPSLDEVLHGHTEL